MRLLWDMEKAMTHRVKIAVGAAALVTMASAAALAESGQRAGRAYDHRYSDSYDYNVPLALPPYGYTPGFWGYGGRRYYDRFGNYRKYGQQPGEPGTGPVETRPLR
jgi:hypothetical protein